MDIVANPEFFRVIDTEAKAYWLGFLAGDAGVRPSQVSLHLAARDADHVLAFRAAVGAVGPPRPRSHVREGRLTLSYELVVRHPGLVADLAAHGVTPDKAAAAVPWAGPPELVPHYWRGQVDANGWLSNGDRPYLGLCGTRAVCEGFCGWAAGVVPHLRHPKPKKSIWVAEFAGRQVAPLARALYAGATIALPRKRAAADLAVARAAPPDTPADPIGSAA